MANTRKVPEGQIPMEENVKEETKPVENPAAVDEPTKEPESPVKDDVKEEKKTILRKIGEQLIASDDKKKQKEAEKLAKKEAKLQAKEAQKAQKGESAGWSKFKKGAIIVGSGLAATAIGLIAYEANKSGDGNAVYVDNGNPTCCIPDQTQAPVAETYVEPAAENISSESAENIVETTSNE